MKRTSAFLLALAAGGCGSSPAEDPAPTEIRTIDEGPRTLVAATIDLGDLGPRIVGPQGDEVESEIAGLGTMVSFVACPDDVEAETCDHATLPGDTLYTYVHTVTIDVPESEQADDQFSGVTLFQTSEPATGFSYSIGYDEDEALAALGEGYEIATQIENGALIWRIVASDGWMPGEKLTFYWRSSQPPAGPAEAFVLQAEGIEGVATGPFPAPEDESGNAAPPN